MTRLIYIIDTSSLIELNKHNPMDIYHTPWKKMDGLVRSKRIFAPKEVLDEIKRFDDALANWAKKHPGMFKDPTGEQIPGSLHWLSKWPAALKGHWSK